MTIRQAAASDTERLIFIRAAVRENRLRDPGAVTRADYDWFVLRGLVWVIEIEGRVAGFSAADPRDGTIWALFVDPAYEGVGAGALLLSRACADLTAVGHKTARLWTDPGTKAARLYQKLGWQTAGLARGGEEEFWRSL
jgi:GNAT superfamily N-acetyltransferase